MTTKTVTVSVPRPSERKAALHELRSAADEFDSVLVTVGASERLLAAAVRYAESLTSSSETTLPDWLQARPAPTAQQLAEEVDAARRFLERSTPDMAVEAQRVIVALADARDAVTAERDRLCAMVAALTESYPSEEARRGLASFAACAEVEGQIDRPSTRAAVEWLEEHAGWKPDR